MQNVAKRFGIDAATVSRYRQRLPAKLVQAKAAAEVSNADDLLVKIQNLETEAHRIKTKAEQAGDLRTALAGIRELTRIVELVARIRGEIDEHTTVNILVQPQWVNIRAVILQALEPFPESRVAVASALSQMEAHP